MKATRSRYAREARSRVAASSSQGTHQDAQKFTRTGLPWAAVKSNAPPPKIWTLNGGAGRVATATLPTLPAACRPMPQISKASRASIATTTTAATIRAVAAVRSGSAGGLDVDGVVSVVDMVVRERQSRGDPAQSERYHAIETRAENARRSGPVAPPSPPPGSDRSP